MTSLIITAFVAAYLVVGATSGLLLSFVVMDRKPQLYPACAATDLRYLFYDPATAFLACTLIWPCVLAFRLFTYAILLYLKVKNDGFATFSDSYARWQQRMLRRRNRPKQA